MDSNAGINGKLQENRILMEQGEQWASELFVCIRFLPADLLHLFLSEGWSLVGQWESWDHGSRVDKFEGVLILFTRAVWRFADMYFVNT